MHAALDAANLPVGGLLVDPFAGTAGIGVIACGRGDRFVGIEAHPLIARLGAVKFARPGPPRDLLDAGLRLAAAAERARPGTHLLEEHPIVVRDVPPAALAALVAARDVAADLSPWDEHCRFAVLAALRDCLAPGLAGPRPGGRRRRAVVSVLLADRIRLMAADLARAPRAPAGHVRIGDSRARLDWPVGDGSADAVVTSPPYLNQVAYAEAIRIEMFFSGTPRRGPT
jgi:hypothetical protein